jgi:ankyrin repeat protein
MQPLLQGLLMMVLASLLAVQPGRLLAADAPARDQSLIAAAESGDLARLKALLAQGANVHARDEQGRTALLAATHGNRVEAARMLLAAGADVNARDAIGDSPFLYAGAAGRLEILRLTLAAGANLKSLNRYGGTALIPACHYGHVETVRELLKTAIAIDHINHLGWTALLETVILGDGGARHQEIARLLLEHGANAQLADRDGVTPLQHAQRRGQTAIAALLLQALERAGRGRVVPPSGRAGNAASGR